MGFEQLAELKKQLAAARAEAAPAAKPVAKPGAKPARKPSPPRRAAPAPKVDAKPVDPVVKSIGKLQKRFPNAFPKNPAPKLPLKVGIFEDLVVHAKELSLTEAELRDAIKTWCRGSRYWKCLVEGAARVDVSGGEAGKVTAQEAAGAQRLQAHRANKGAPKAAASPAGASATASAEAATDAPTNTPTEAAATPQGDPDSQPQAGSTDTPAVDSTTPPATPPATTEA